MNAATAMHAGMPGMAAGLAGRLAATLIVAAWAGSALAQPAYPSRPIRAVVAFGPGGISDTIGRLAGVKMAERLGQSIVIDNRPGAGGALAARIVANASPDGHTLLITTTAVAVSPSTVRDAVNPVTQLVPVANTAAAPTVIVVHASVTARGLLEFVRGSKGGRFTFSSAGVGTTEHLTGEYLFRSVPGLQATHVPYPGGIATVAAVVANQVDLSVTTVPTGYPLIRDGRVRAIAMASRKRLAVLPEVPTVAEAGFPEFENASWVGWFAPVGTPAAVVARLNAEANAAIRQPDVRDRLALIGFEPQSGSVAEFTRFVQEEVAKWANVVKATGYSAN
jgi:tripartite-type tricarboxylate transporter receptor subunit TctC